MEWIKVSERKPGEDESVLMVTRVFTRNDGSECRMMERDIYYDDDRDVFVYTDDDCNEHDLNDVVAWMPWPKVYTGD